MFFVFQVLEHDTPEQLLLDVETIFSKMVESTGPANAQYLWNIVFQSEANKSRKGECGRIVGKKRWLATSRWAAAAQVALAAGLTSSRSYLQRSDVEGRDQIIDKTNDAIITLQGVLEGKHDHEINEKLLQHGLPRDGWWSALLRIIEGSSYNKVLYLSSTISPAEE